MTKSWKTGCLKPAALCCYEKNSPLVKQKKEMASSMFLLHGLKHSSWVESWRKRLILLLTVNDNIVLHRIYHLKEKAIAADMDAGIALMILKMFPGTDRNLLLKERHMPPKRQ